MFIVLSSWQSHCESSLGHAITTEMASGGRQPLDQANRLEPQARLYRQPVKHIHHCHVLLLSLKADTHFAVPWRVEGWVDLGGCYTPRWFTCPQMVTYPSINWAWRRVASLMCPLHQTVTVISYQCTWNVCLWLLFAVLRWCGVCDVSWCIGWVSTGRLWLQWRRTW